MQKDVGSEVVKRGLAQMLKGGVIMDVVTPEHARIAEDAGACAVMALERVPADIRATGGVARMSDPELILKIIDSVSIPVMAKCRIGHFVEAQVLEALGGPLAHLLEPRQEQQHQQLHQHDHVRPGRIQRLEKLLPVVHGYAAGSPAGFLVNLPIRL